MATKKRSLLPKLEECIIFLSNLTGPVSKMEMTDNDVCSRQLKRAISEFKHQPLERFTQAVNEIRSELRAKPRRAYTKKENSTTK